MNKASWHIAAHEIRLSRKDRYFRLILIFLVAMTLFSTVLGALQMHQQMAAYQSSVDLLKSMGKVKIPPPPVLNPLGASKDFVNYTSMIGALLAILVGWNSIRNEKQGKTINLILSRPVYRDNLILGKFSGMALVLLVISAFSFAAVYLLIQSLTGFSMTLNETGRMGAYFLAVWLYMLVFASLAQLITIAAEDDHSALLITIILWLVFTFLLPQIGDTMDLDNQIPGGFFSYLGLDKTQEKNLMAHFAWYEYVRDGLEELSPTKHFERLSYALLNIKPGFADYTTMQVLGSKILNFSVLILTPVIFIIATMAVFLKRETAHK